MIKNYFEEYKNTKEGFELFSNETINMPRDKFNDAGIKKIQLLSSYLLLINDYENNSLSYKNIMELIRQKLKEGKEPILRDYELESKYFNFDKTLLDEHYEVKGREFRHLMGLCKLFNLLNVNEVSKRLSEVNFEKCKEFALSKNNSFNPSIRNSILEININNNPYINSLKNVSKHITNKSDYPLALSIVKYIKEMNRPVTRFEISVLLGRVDKLDKENDILSRAIYFGNMFPKTSEEQKYEFFNYMNWINDDDTLFQYKSSGEPWFKFNTFLLLMENFNLINIENEFITLTSYSNKILNEEIPAYIADLEQLLTNFDEESTKDSEIINTIIQVRYKGLKKFLKNDDSLIDIINKRSIRNTKFTSNNKRKRNDLVMLFSKLLKNYNCDVVYSVDQNGNPSFNFNKFLFANPQNIGYCEGHHILEFSRENGPDIVENIVLLDPNTHMLIHHGHPELKKQLYSILRNEKIVSFDTFLNMIDKYNCLTEEHVNILYNKGLIYFNEKPILLNKIKN
ncbi:hypothetical protein NGC05_02240 [Staphylococcus succinus]|uniref:hypothetical protein n=1 Tax=Staphylococcus succinus TaxID=61015 RepID=UPI002DBEFD0C|nr:hypothetical protein [Staphylococcus succinus]MEB7461494.1 hypothetical protein [Staphylococcus succinus]